MDPTESEKVRQALTSQGARIGQHDAALQEFSEALQGLSAGISELGGRMEQIYSQVSLAAPVLLQGPAASSALDSPVVAPVFSGTARFSNAPLVRPLNVPKNSH